MPFPPSLCMAEQDLSYRGLFWFYLVWLGLVLFGLEVWFGLVWCVKSFLRWGWLKKQLVVCERNSLQIN